MVVCVFWVFCLVKVCSVRVCVCERETGVGGEIRGEKRRKEGKRKEKKKRRKKQPGSEVLS